MARSDLLVQLVKASLANDRASVEKYTEVIIAEERKKQHHVLAERLYTALKSSPVSSLKNQSLSAKGRQTNGKSLGKSVDDFLATLSPRRNLTELFLPDVVKQACSELVEEQHRADLLRSYGLEPRHRVLLAGPPGNGKTSLAEALAYELGVSLFVVRYETVIGSFLGETSSRLKQIFDYARTVPCVLFFDEFDTLGKERGDSHETGEIKRVVSGLLLQIDDLPSHTVVVTATNHPELLDRAVWRRFQLRLDVPSPSRRQLEEYFAMFLARFDVEAGYQPSTLAKRLYGASFAEVEEFCLDVQRKYVLSIGQASLKNIVASQMRLWKSRFTPRADV